MRDPGYPIADLHEDIAYFLQRGDRDLVRDFDRDIPGRHGDIPKYMRGGVKLIFSALFPALETWDPRLGEISGKLYGGRASPRSNIFTGLDNLFEQLKIYYRLSEEYRRYIEIVYEGRDLEFFDRDDKIRFLISLEGADPLANPDDLEIVFRLGVRALGITWNYDNKYGASCTSNKDYGLTEAGERLVSLANKLGVVIDVSHSSRRTALDVLSISKQPVIASHSNYHGRKPHRRNIDDEIIEGIKRSGGVIGFTLIRSTIGGSESIDDLILHILDVWQRFGSDVIAIGSDLFGIETTPEGIRDAGDLRVIIDKLAEKGFGDNDLRKISHENVLRILRSVSSRWSMKSSAST
ncbi:MAG: dipeptidase [Sulfolobales archaeon]